LKQVAAYPFLRILLPLLAGIVTGMAAETPLHQHPEWRLVISISCIALVSGVLLFRNQSIGSWWAVLTLFTCGLWIWNSTDARNRKSHYVHLPSKGIWSVELLQDAEGKGRYAGSIARLLSFTDSTGKTRPASGKLRVMLRRDHGERPVCGNTYYIYGQLAAPNGPQIPGAFDYREYLRRKQVYASLRADSGSYRLTGRKTGIRSRAADLARGIEQRIHAFPEQSRAALLISLITGDKSNVSEEDRLHFAQTGTLHVLAVSGLHVGIIYGLLLFLTGRFFRRNHPVQAVIILVIVWAYALVSGLAPSVFRAAFMFSLLTLGNVWSRRSKGLNTLSAAAVCMLVIEPRWLQDIGFLLSFTAVAGIMLFYPRLDKAWQPRSKVLAYVWKMSAVSIAAQAGTLPVTLYCFNSFPLWFLPANLLIIPISTLCLISGLAFLSLGALPFAGGAFSWLTDHLLRLLQVVVGKLASMPMQTLDGIFPDAAAVAALTVLLVLFAAGNLLPLRYRVAGIVLGLLVISASESARLWRNRFNNTVSYAFRWQQGTAVLSAGRGEAVLMTSNLRAGQTDSLGIALKNWFRRKGIQKVAIAPRQATEVPDIMMGSTYRLINGERLYLAKVSVCFEEKKGAKTILLHRRSANEKITASERPSVKQLKPGVKESSWAEKAVWLNGIEYHRLRIPASGYIEL
jgi:competence protein ComEC